MILEKSGLSHSFVLRRQFREGIMSNTNIGKAVKEDISDFLDKNGLELYNIEFVKEGKDRFLKIYIDHKWVPGMNADSMPGISTYECENVSRYISEILDSKDYIKGAYVLEVSSPGMDRPLIKDEHYARYAGKDVEISLYKAIDGRKKISGKLGKLDNGILEVTTEAGIPLNLPIKSIAKTKLKVVF